MVPVSSSVIRLSICAGAGRICIVTCAGSKRLLIELLADYEIAATTRKGLTGVWVEDRKIASIGVGVRHWITMHGFALNVCGDLSPFDQITPCGIANVTMTSMEKETGTASTGGRCRSLADMFLPRSRARVAHSPTRAVWRFADLGALPKRDGARAPSQPQRDRYPEKSLPRFSSRNILRHMAIPLEDNFTDIIGKAQRGLGISDSQLAEKSKVRVDRIRELRDGKIDDDASDRIAPVLKLDPAPLVESAQAQWKPQRSRDRRPRAIQHTVSAT